MWNFALRNSAMLGCKRPRPFDGFEDRPHSSSQHASSRSFSIKACNTATQSVYESTLDKLKAGARTSMQHSGFSHSKNHVRKSEMEIEDTASSQLKCGFCLREVQCTAACFHCMKVLCDSCVKPCDGCDEQFCSTCSITNYEERLDRLFCFECNAEDLERRQFCR